MAFKSDRGGIEIVMLPLIMAVSVLFKSDRGGIEIDIHIYTHIHVLRSNQTVAGLKYGCGDTNRDG